MKRIRGISEIINNYDHLILDQWGVMHNGEEGFKTAINCVNKLYDKKINLIIISNSSKRKNLTKKKLANLGFNPNHFSEVMTSGEMIWQSLFLKKNDFSKKLKNNCYYINNKSIKKNDFITGLENYNFVKEIDDADFILACDLSTNKKTIEYIPLLRKALKKNLLFVCANPDYESLSKNNKLEICMGTIAELYKSLGGNIVLLGKPKIDIYVESTKNIKKINKKRILAIGDSIHHDIKGANSFGIDSVLITSGIHRSNFDNKNPNWNNDLNKLKNFNIKPTFLCSKFQL